jgi:hypothetical protein
MGKKVQTPEGEGKVIRQNIMERISTVILENGEEYDLEHGQLPPKPQKSSIQPAAEIIECPVEDECQPDDPCLLEEPCSDEMECPEEDDRLSDDPCLGEEPCSEEKECPGECDCRPATPCFLDEPYPSGENCPDEDERTDEAAPEELETAVVAEEEKE